MSKNTATASPSFDLERGINRIFSNGWGFLVPYLLFYLFALAFNLSRTAFFVVFDGIHIAVGIAFCAYLYRLRKMLKAGDWIFWGGLFGLLLLPGAYLEYPSDPWEHVLRIFSWQRGAHIRDVEHSLKFFSGWAYSLLRHLEIPQRRTGLGFVAALTQWLFAFQIYRVSLTLGLEKNWAKLSTVACLILFGNSALSFGYYALAATMFSYVAYLAAFRIFLEPHLPPRKKIAEIGLLSLFMFFDHRQELFLLAILLPTAWFGLAWQRGGSEKRRRLLGGFIGLILFCWAFGLFTLWADPVTYARVGLSSAERWRVLKPWISKHIIIDVLGVHGILGLISAAILFRTYPLVACLTWVPLLSTACSPLLYPMYRLQHLTYASDSYRLLYIFTTTFALIFGLRKISDRLGRPGPYLAACLLILLAVPLDYPWRGRLQFQFYRADPVRSLEPIDQTVAWFAANRKYPDDCYWIADDPTIFTLSANLAWPMRKKTPDQYNFRSETHRTPNSITTQEQLEELMKRWKVCGFLFPKRDQLPTAAPSKIARSSKHWKDEATDFDQLNPAKYGEVLKTLLNKGWTTTDVPPYFTLYERKADRL